jgi:putative SOS response-associated peptidase YedK
VPASGFYEWKKADAGKQPYLIKSSSGLMAFAGLWDHWEGEASAIDSFSIIVTDANKKIAPVHDRMPVILHEKDYDTWLNPGSPADKLKSLLVAGSDDDILLYPVSKYVNSPANDDPGCLGALSE